MWINSPVLSNIITIFNLSLGFFLSKGSWNSDVRSWHDMVDFSPSVRVNSSISSIGVTIVINNWIFWIFFLVNTSVIIFVSVGELIGISIDLEIVFLWLMELLSLFALVLLILLGLN
jgi:hypothetical protein